uniref:L-arabinose isomerase n=1 Tax=Blautia faecicola TaxID=2509240 RepID=UPI0035219625
MKATKNYKFWFATGSQDLYGDECLQKVAEHSQIIVNELNKSGILPYEVVWKPTLITNEVIRKTFNEANADEECAGVITWMHTFSPAKSWILGLQEYRKPLLHLHTQFNEEIPYDTIDMDFMNENQSAHGDREFGHIVSRMGMVRKVVVGHWATKEVQEKIASWMRTAVGVMESSHIRVMRIADNMRNVAVTEGDKVEAQIKFGWEVDAYPVNEIAEAVQAVGKGDVDALVEEYYSKYQILLEGRDPEEFKKHVAVQAQIEIGFERFLEEKNYQAIVTHFGDLGALQQLPGLAIQRLMEKGYGFGGEGDWKTAAMVRLMKIMTAGKKDAKGTSFMEDYTYNLIPGKEGVLEAHMLEVCPTIADGPISIKVNPLSMGDREDPARLVFTSKTGPAIATSLVDLGNRFRLIINDVDCKKTEKEMPKLPVATAFWTPQPDLATGAEAWILAGGAHHTAFSYDITAEQMGDWAEAMGIEAVYIDKDTKIRQFKSELKWNSMYYMLNR